MDLSYLITWLEEAIRDNEELNIGLRVYDGDLYFGILVRDFLIDPVYLGKAPTNFLDKLHSTIIEAFKDLVTPMTVHTTGMDYTYYLTINEIYIQFPKDDINWIIERMHKNEEITIGSR